MEFHLGELTKFHPGLSRGVLLNCAEAAAVCLEGQGHVSGSDISVHQNTPKKDDDVKVHWDTVDDTMRRAHADPQDATEEGACSLAFHVIDEMTDFTIFERSAKGTGIDHWLSPEGKPGDYFQKANRLEISGVLKEKVKEAEVRVNTKVVQTQKSDDTDLPAIIVVAEFGQPKILVHER